MPNKTVSNIKLRTFTENDYNGIVSLRNSLYPDHPKTVEMVKHRDTSHKGKIKQKRFVFKKNGTIIVYAGYTQYFEAYHPQKFAIYIHVHSDHINKGYGNASYCLLMEELQPFDPIKITCEINEIHHRGVRFLVDRGFSLTLKEQESELDLSVYNPYKFKHGIERVLNQGFQIITLSEFQEEDKKADYKCWELEHEVSPDMPWTDPISIPDYDHYKKYILAHPRFNSDSWFITLDKTVVAGMSNLWKTSIDAVISTGFTGVRRKYRQKGIATALKHTNLTWAKNQGYQRIRTTNVDSNKAMLDINLHAGFKFIPAWLVFDKIIKEEK